MIRTTRCARLRRTGPFLAGAALAGTLAAAALAQVRPLPERLAPTAGEPAVIRGRVTAADTGAPVTLAQVSIHPRPGGGNATAATDATGRFELVVPPGRYRVHASKAGYLSLDDDERGAFGEGTRVAPRAGEMLDVDLTLQRGGVITGTVYDPFGDPAVDLGVRVLHYVFDDGRWQLSSPVRGNPAARTDDRGVFRVYGLPPGTYFVQATPPAWRWGQRGVRTYAPAFYPGAVDLEAAQAVEIAAGEEVTGFDFALTGVLTANVSGRVAGPYGRPVSDVPSVSLIRMAGPRTSRSSGRLEADGRFVVNGVAPGRYVAYAAETGLPGQTRFATAEVVVAGGDVDGVRLELTSGASARGRILFDSETPPPFTPDELQPFTMPRGDDIVPVGRGIGHVNDDWTFEIRGIAGQQLVRLAGLRDGWTLRMVGLAGRDITDTPIMFPEHLSTTGLQILLTDRTTTLTGTAVDARGEATPDYTVLIFPDDPDLRVFPSRFVRTVRPDPDGVFTVSGLPPSRYLAFAAPALPRGASSNLQLLAELAPAAARFSLGEGETRELTLRLRSLRQP